MLRAGLPLLPLTNNASAFQYATIQTPAHLTAGGSSVPSTFKNTTFNAATDTFAPMPTLTIIIARFCDKQFYNLQLSAADHFAADYAPHHLCQPAGFDDRLDLHWSLVVMSRAAQPSRLRTRDMESSQASTRLTPRSTLSTS